MSLARQLLFTAPILCVSLARAQVQLEWDRHLQIALPERLFMGEAQPDSNGGWYVTGARAVSHFNPGYPNYWLSDTPLLLRLDAQGLVTAIQNLAPAGTAGGVPTIGVDATGGIVTTGSPASSWISRMDPAGNTLWSAPFPPGVESFAKFVFTPSGGVNAGVFRINTTPFLMAAGWDAAGTSAFTNTLPNQSGLVCATSPAGDVGIASASNFFHPGIVAVFDPTGTMTWSATVPMGTEINTAHFTPSGGLVVAGKVGPHPQVQGWTASGAPAFTYTDSALNQGRIDAMDVSSDGFIACAGLSLPTVSSHVHGWVLLLDANGNAIWARSWSGTVAQYEDQFERVIFRATGEVVAGGTTYLTADQSQPLTQAAPSVAAWRRDGTLDFEYVGVHLYNEEHCRSLFETTSGSIVYASAATSYVSLETIPEGGRLISLRRLSEAYCFGDGTGTACPCGNQSAAGASEGCLSSLSSGGKLASQGTSSLTNDTVVLNGAQMTNGACLYFQGTARQSGGAGSVFGDGLRCAAGTITRLHTKSNVAGASTYPESGDPSVSVRGGVSAAGTRTYQVWYRNAAAFCTPSTFNLTNGLEITWLP